MPFPGRPLKPVECYPANFKSYALWCWLVLWPEPGPADIPDWIHQHWKCTSCDAIFGQQDEASPQRCLACGAEAVPTSFCFLPPRPPWDPEA